MQNMQSIRGADMKITIDRFEEGFAVCLTEDNIKIDIPSGFIQDASEGDVYELTFKKLPDQKDIRHKAIEGKAKRLWAD